MTTTEIIVQISDTDSQRRRGNGDLLQTIEKLHDIGLGKAAHSRHEDPFSYLAPKQMSIWNFPSLPMFLDVLLMARMKRQK